MAAAVLLFPPAAASLATPRTSSFYFGSKSVSKTPPLPKILVSPKQYTSLSSSAGSGDITSTSIATVNDKKERLFFDGGAHYGDLVTNLLLGFTLVWLPLTIAAVSRAFFLRYRFTNRRITVISGFTGQDRSDFPYSAIKDVQVVPRLIGEWGDIIITLKDGTKVDILSVPRFRMVADYCLLMADGVAKGSLEEKSISGPRRGF